MDAIILPADQEEGRTMWRALWDASPQRSPFSGLAFAGALHRALDIKHRFLFLAEATGPVCGMLLFEKQTGPFRRLVVPPFTPYTSPLLLPEVDASRAMGEILKALDQRYAAAAIHLAPGLEIDAVHEQWKARPLSTLLVNPGPLDSVMPTWSGNARWRFRRYREEFTIEEGREFAGDAVRLAHASYVRHKKAFPSRPDQALTLVTEMAHAGEARILAARERKSGEIMAAAVFLICGTDAYYWLIGSVPGPSMTVLLGSAIPRLYEVGIRRLDLVGANTPSIAEFKRRFGPEPSSYLRLEQSPSYLFRLLERLR